MTGGLCFESDTDIWAECTAGYQRPEIVYLGVVNCTSVDRTTGTWRVTFQFGLSGGNHNGAIWTLDDENSGRGTWLLTGVNDIPSELPFSMYVTAYLKPMNGFAGSIDIIQGYLEPNVDLRGYCI